MRSLFLFEFNLEIEGTFRFRQKKLRLEEKKLKAQEASSTVARGGRDQRRMLRGFITPGALQA